MVAGDGNEGFENHVNPASSPDIDTDERGDTRLSNSNRRGSDVNLLIGDAMDLLNERAIAATNEARLSALGNKVAPVAGSDDDSGRVSGLLSASGLGRGASPVSLSALINETTDHKSDRTSEFLVTNPYDETFQAVRAEKEYVEYAAFTNRKSFKLFTCITAGLASINLALEGALAASTASGSYAFSIPLPLLLIHLAGLTIALYFAVKSEHVLLNPNLFAGLYIAVTVGYAAPVLAIAGRVTVSGVFMNFLYDFGAGILFAKYRECLIFAAVKVPIGLVLTVAYGASAEEANTVEKRVFGEGGLMEVLEGCTIPKGILTHSEEDAALRDACDALQTTVNEWVAANDFESLAAPSGAAEPFLSERIVGMLQVRRGRRAPKRRE